MRVKPDKSHSEKILALIQEVGCISRLSVKSMDIYPSKQTEWLNRLTEANMILPKRLEGYKIYTITAEGAQYLKTINKIRHRDDTPTNGLNADMMERKAKISEVVSLLKRAKFATHPDDKPQIFKAVEQIRQIGSAFDRCNPGNVQTHIYRFLGCHDRKEYVRHSTAINCFYDSKELKDYLSKQMREQFGMYTEHQAISFSRIIGLLITPSVSYCIYNTGRKAMQLKMAGETAMQVALADVVSSLTGQKIVRMESVLVFGEGFKGAYQLLAASKKQLPNSKKKLEANAGQYPPSVMQITKIGKKVLYLPLLPESSQILKMLAYPDWQDFLREMALGESYRPTEGRYLIFDGEMQGVPVYLEFIPDLRRFESLLHYLRGNEPESILIACPDCHIAFYETVTKNEDLLTKIRFYSFTADNLSAALEALQLHYFGKDDI